MFFSVTKKCYYIFSFIFNPFYLMKKEKTCCFPVRKYLAELIGTFTLTFLVTLSITGTFPIATPLLAGLVLAIFVYTIGAISGCHINPAVTIGLWTRKKICWKDSIFYILFQFIGAGLAMLLAQHYTGGMVPDVVAGANVDPIVMFAEALGMILFTFGISAAVDDNVPAGASGFAVGGSLFLGILIAMGASNGILNPAVAFGLGSFSFSYVAGPIIGSIIGFALYHGINSKETSCSK